MLNHNAANILENHDRNHNNNFNVEDIAIYIGLTIAVILVILLIVYCIGCFNNRGNTSFVRIVEDSRHRQLTHQELLAQLNGASPMLDRIADRRKKEAAALQFNAYGTI